MQSVIEGVPPGIEEAMCSHAELATIGGILAGNGAGCSQDSKSVITIRLNVVETHHNGSQRKNNKQITFALCLLLCTAPGLCVVYGVRDADGPLCVTAANPFCCMYKAHHRNPTFLTSRTSAQA